MESIYWQKLLRCGIGACLFMLISIGAAGAESSGPATIGGLTPEEALFAGEKMYREGILPTGQPMQAYVQGDIPVNGSMFSCESCHLRSGLGSAEGTKIVFPVNAAKLFIPLHHGAEIQISPPRDMLSKAFLPGDVRPAYTDETLAMAIWSGKRPTGEDLDQTMPRYLLSAEHMAILVHYLKNLSAEFSPGVTDTEMYLATVVTEGVPPNERAAMLKTLDAYLKVKNSQNRPQARRAQIGPWYRQGRFTPYRKLVHSVWELKGPSETWQQQLEQYYSKQPVFALIGGMSSEGWEPIHRFCEQNRLPSIFPLTDRPVVNEQDWYTLYFSRGPFQEGAAAARYLRGTGRQASTQNVVQLIENTPASRQLADGFRSTWRAMRQPAPKDILIDAQMDLDKSFTQKLAANHPGASFLVWLDAGNLDMIEQLAAAEQSSIVIASAPLLEKNLYQLSESVRAKTYFTYPDRLPEDRQRREIVLKKWLAVHKVPVIDLDIQAKVYFLGWMLSGGLKMLTDEYYQDYLLDAFDMMNDEYYSIINYPRVSFGQGQRYAVKGCYIVQLGQGEEPGLLPKSDWVIQ